MNVTGSDDRAATRKPLQVDTPVLDTRTGRFLEGRSRNVSDKGIFVESGDHPPVGALVELFIGGLGIGAQVLGRIVRTVPGEGFAAQFSGDSSSVRSLLR